MSIRNLVNLYNDYMNESVDGTFTEFLYESFSKSEASRIGNELGIDWDKIDFDQFHMGLKVELEHSDVSKDPLVIGKIALAHLKEKSNYYTELHKMESGKCEDK